MALTATATEGVQQDIVRSLKMSRNRLFVALHPFNRANLYYEVRYLSSSNPNAHMVDVYEYINTLHERRGRASSGIVYCRTRAVCDEMARFLSGKGLNAKAYHRGLSSSVLDRTLRDWDKGGAGVPGGVDVVCATIAFGMGIDKADVRYIIHFDLPKSFEGYYQETGRAGRDGLPAKCVLFYSREDATRVKHWVADSHSKRIIRAESSNGPEPSQRAADSLSALVNYAENANICRHVLICRYFGEKIDLQDDGAAGAYCNKMCDVCKYPNKTRTRKLTLSSQDDVDAMPWRPQAREHPDPADGHGESSRAARGTSFGIRRMPSGAASDANTSSRRTSTKRPGSSTDGPQREPYGGAKKVKTMPTVPVHISTTLRQSLHRGFKTPFKVPFKSAPGVDASRSTGGAIPPGPSHSEEVVVTTKSEKGKERAQEEFIDDGPHHLADDCGGRGTLEGSTATEERPSSPIHLPETDVELDAAYSQKIPTAIRNECFAALRKALHKVLPTGDVSASAAAWSRLKLSSADPDTKTAILSSAAREVEFGVHALCRTTDGYKERAAAQLNAVRLLARPEAWSPAALTAKAGSGAADEEPELEDAREAADTVKRVARRKSRA